MKSSLFAGIAGLVLIWALAIYPPINRSGTVAELTLAYATADAPSGVYYDRDFDWPTGEAVCVDIPAYVLHVSLLALTLLGVLHSYTNRVPTVA